MYKFICKTCGKESSTLTKRKVCYLCAYQPDNYKLIKQEIGDLWEAVDSLIAVVKSMSDELKKEK